MNNNWAVVGSRVRRLALGGAVLGLTLALSSAPSFAKKDEPKKEEVSAKVAEKLKPAQAALQKDDFDTGIAQAKEGLALAEKPYDKIMSLNLMKYGYSKKKDYAALADAFEQLNAIESLPQEDRIASYKPLAQIYYQQKNFEKALPNAVLWADNGGGQDGIALVTNIYLIQKDCKNGIVWLEKSVAGRDPTEQELKQENYCYYQNGDKDKREQVLVTLVKRFPAHDYVADLLLIYEEQKVDERALLNLFRFSFDKDYMTRESEFTEYADDALQVGSPSEALTVINKALEKNAMKMIAASDRPSRMFAQAKQQSAEDHKQIGALDREAQAGKNGEADVKVGQAYLGMGEYQKAVDAITRGLSADRVAKVKRVDDANMMLGIAYAKLGDKANASKAFTAAQADPRMAKAATVWLNSII
jgi:lipopolysaccharide biosynthesis regulator YciM